MDYSLILKNVNRHVSLESDEIDYFTSLLELRTVKRKEFLVSEGDVARYIHFVTKGCLRNYQIGIDGVIHISFFAIEEWWISDLSSFLTQEPATSFVDALEDTQVFSLSNDHYEQLFLNIPKFERFFRILHQKAYIAQNNRIMENISLTAKERYLNFLERSPSLSQRIPQKQIAAYLGITPEFLSMLRSRMAKS